MRRLTQLAALALLALLSTFSVSALAKSKMEQLQSNQYAWSGAIRWGDFEGALSLIDPAYREAHPVSDLELKRYEQVQITAYRERNSSADKKGGVAMRDIEIGVVNRHTQAERTVRYREEWRWNDADKNWWLVTGLPDLWGGE
ncbi:hypothetical protein [Lysobacter panacisoli]|uniref:DUF4440 domain-containing protein n=1 Tax=Lysobacter panacisoli TaxID=1255263 RepID=A0ABP9KY08_9GAMM|nr:hypothetical protein [Lysobacter panacisoli]